MKSFVLADLSDDCVITIAKIDFSLKKGKSYRFNFAEKNHIREVLKYLAKHKGLFRYLETDSYVNCIETFSLAKERFEVQTAKATNNFKGNKRKVNSERLIKVDREDPEEGKGEGFPIEDFSENL